VIVVSNTSPVTNLAAIGQFDLLRLLVEAWHIPNAVRGELKAEGRPAPRERGGRHGRGGVRYIRATPQLAGIAPVTRAITPGGASPAHRAFALYSPGLVKRSFCW